MQPANDYSCLFTCVRPKLPRVYVPCLCLPKYFSSSATQLALVCFNHSRPSKLKYIFFNSLFLPPKHLKKSLPGVLPLDLKLINLRFPLLQLLSVFMSNVITALTSFFWDPSCVMCGYEGPLMFHRLPQSQMPAVPRVSKRLMSFYEIHYVFRQDLKKPRRLF